MTELSVEQKTPGDEEEVAMGRKVSERVGPDPFTPVHS
jgi:hypothetical protein